MGTACDQDLVGFDGQSPLLIPRGERFSQGSEAHGVAVAHILGDPVIKGRLVQFFDEVFGNQFAGGNAAGELNHAGALG